MLLRRIQLRTSLSRNSRNLLKPAPHTLKVLRLDRSVVRAQDSASRDEDDVDRELTLRPLSAEDFPEEPLRAVSLDGASDLPAGDEPDPQTAFLRHEHERHEEGIHPPSSFAIDALEVRPASEANGSSGFGLPSNRKTMPALAPAPSEHRPAGFRAHPHAKTVSAAPSASIWLERSFHFLMTPVS